MRERPVSSSDIGSSPKTKAKDAIGFAELGAWSHPYARICEWPVETSCRATMKHVSP